MQDLRYTPEEQERFWSKVEVGDCWEWTGGCTNGQYGNIAITRDKVLISLLAHRVAYQMLVGPIPDGLELDHLCRNHACVNPDHLEPVTHQENMLRGSWPARQRAKTHCKHGHEFTTENTVWQAPNKPGARMRRGCRECRNKRRRKPLKQ